MVHKSKGHYSDTKHPIIIVENLGNKKVKGSIQKGKKPINQSFKTIINVIDHKKLKILRNLRQVNYLNWFGGGFRRTEFISIDHEDLEFVLEVLKSPLKDQNHFGEGMIKGLPYLQ